MPSKSPTIDFVENDNGRAITYDLLLDGVGYELTGGSEIECHMQNTKTDATTVVSTVTADGDQSTYPGRCTTTFASTDLVEGRYTLEWQVTDGSIITTFPGVAAQRPVMTVRPEAG